MNESVKNIISKSAQALFLVFMILALLCAAPRSAACSGLSAEQVLGHPELLHQRLKAKNPGYNGRARFAKVQDLGLVGDFAGSRISDLSPLAGIPFNALDLKGQPISDLKPLIGMPLTVLGFDDTRVMDLSPLKALKLTRLVFTPGSITKGLDVARNIKTLTEAGTSLDVLMPPGEFWSRHDGNKGK